jgi:hypothetical protein
LESEFSGNEGGAGIPVDCRRLDEFDIDDFSVESSIKDDNERARLKDTDLLRPFV